MLSTCSLLFAPDLPILASCSSLKLLRLSGADLLRAPDRAAAFAPDGALLDVLDAVVLQRHVLVEVDLFLLVPFFASVRASMRPKACISRSASENGVIWERKE